MFGFLPESAPLVFSEDIAMARRYIFTCNHCGFSVDRWEDGNRYLEWPIGTRNYLYHPADIQQTEQLVQEIYGHSPTPYECQRAFQMYGGNETEFLCCDCLAINRIDVKREPQICASLTPPRYAPLVALLKPNVRSVGRAISTAAK